MVHRSKLEKIKAILTSEYWLLFSLAGVFFSYFARGSGANFFLNLTGIFIIVELLLGNYRIKQIPRWYLVIAAICAYLVLASVLNPYAYSKLRNIKRLVRMVIIVFAIHCLSHKDEEDRVTVLFGGLLVVSVCWQFAARDLFNMPFGTFNNSQRLANFAALALPAIIYFVWVTRDWYRFLFIPVALLDTDLLLHTGSRSAYLALICGALFVIIVLIKGRHRWYGLISVFLILALLSITDYAGINSQVKNFILNLSSESRIKMWQASLEMLKDNSLIAWIIGNGIGGFSVAFSKYVAPRFNQQIHPHNYFPEVLYDNGIVGFILIFGGLGYLFFQVVTITQKTRIRMYSILLKCTITTFLVWFIQCCLNFPFFSTFTLYPLGFILGIMLVMMERISRDEVLRHNKRG